MSISPCKAQRIVILGAGFGGIEAALHLERTFAREKSVEITLVNQDNYMLFSPMLPEVTSSSIEARHIIAPIRAFFRKVRFRDSRVNAVDFENRVVRASHGPGCPEHHLEFDHLVLALGSVTSFYGLPGVRECALPLKTLGDAMTLRNHIVDMLEHADIEPDPEIRRQLLAVVVAGAGFAGVEVAAELQDFLHRARRFYPNIQADEVGMVLVDLESRILPGIAESLAGYARKTLARRGVEIRLKTGISRASSAGVDLDDGSHIPTKTLVWTAGVAPNPLLERLPLQKERGRVVVDEFLEAPGHPGVWALGDCAWLPDPKTGRPYPPTAQHAVRQGRRVGENIAAAIRGRSKKSFAFSSMGQLVPLGRRSAVAEILGFKFRGFFAWWLWRTIYLSKLPGLERKVRVAVDWTLDLFLPRDTVLLKMLLKSAPEKLPADRAPVGSSA